MNIVDKIQKMIARTGDFKPGVQHIEVKHDDGCPALNTHSLADCTCNPDFNAKRPDA
jgi:hypothetical protein